MSLSVLPGAQRSVYILCPLQRWASPAGSVPPSIWWLVISFLLPWCLGGSSDPSIDVSIAQFLLYCDISLYGQSDKSHMTSPHERTTAASSRCCSAHCPWSGKLKSIWVAVKEFTMSWKGICSLKGTK